MGEENVCICICVCTVFHYIHGLMHTHVYKFTLTHEKAGLPFTAAWMDLEDAMLIFQPNVYWEAAAVVHFFVVKIETVG